MFPKIVSASPRQRDQLPARAEGGRLLTLYAALRSPDRLQRALHFGAAQKPQGQRFVAFVDHDGMIWLPPSAKVIKCSS